MYGRRTNYLFQGSPVHGFIHGTQTRAMRQLEVLDENTILNTPTEDLVAGALSACAVDFPTLREGEIWQEDNEVLRDMPYRGYDFYTDQHGGTRSMFHLTEMKAYSMLSQRGGPSPGLLPT